MADDKNLEKEWNEEQEKREGEQAAINSGEESPFDEYLCVNECQFKNRIYSPNARWRDRRIVQMPKGEKIDPSVAEFFIPFKGKEIKEDFNTKPQPTAMSEANQKVLSAGHRMAEIKKAIANLKPDDFTSGGPPRVKSIEDTCGFDISKDERDLAWNQIQAEKTKEAGNNEK